MASDPQTTAYARGLRDAAELCAAVSAGLMRKRPPRQRDSRAAAVVQAIEGRIRRMIDPEIISDMKRRAEEDTIRINELADKLGYERFDIRWHRSWRDASRMESFTNGY